MVAQLVAKQVIEWLPDPELANSRLDRVVWLGPVGGAAFLVDVDTEGALPRPVFRDEVDRAIAMGRARVLPNDPFAYLLRPESAFSDAQREGRDRRYELIRPFAEMPMPDQLRAEVRGALMRRLLKEAIERGKRIHRETIYDLLSLYYRRGMIPNAVMPELSRRGGKGKIRAAGPDQAKRGRPSERSRKLSAKHGTVIRLGVNVTAHDRKLFAEGIRLFHKNTDGWTVGRTYLATMHRYWSCKERQEDGTWKDDLLPAEQRPTRRQFEYWFGKVVDRLTVIIARAGRRNYNLKLRPLVGDPRKLAFGPGSLEQIDATIADIYLVRADDPHKLIGKPVIYIIIDAFSRMVVGISVSLSGPSWMEAREALLNMAEDKVAFCARYGVKITTDQWPCAYLPDAMVADRGELLSKNSDVLAGPALKIRISNTGSFRADLKPYVERHFRTLKDITIRWLPGGYYEPRNRGERDYRYDAMLTIEEFTRLLIETVVHYNNHHRLTGYKLTRRMRLDGVRPYPIELWNWGMKHRIGGLKPGDVPSLRRLLLPKAQALITDSGLSFEGRHYMPVDEDEHAEAVRRVTQARISGSDEVGELSYHPANLETVYLPPLRVPKGALMTWSLIREPDQIMRNLSWFDWADIRNDETIDRDKARTDDDQAQLDLMQKEDAIVEGAKVRLKESRNGRSRSSRVQDVKESRAAEADRLLQHRIARDEGRAVPSSAASTDALSAPPRVTEFRPRERHTGPPWVA